MRPEQYLSNTTASLRAFHSLSDAQARELELGMALWCPAPGRSTGRRAMTGT